MLPFRSRALALASALAVSGAVPSAADFVFLGFGDSITRATACPVDCSTEFDELGLDGYVGRLDTRLGAGYTVENHGIGGESTGEGLTRIDSVLAGGGDVLLLMEGTNDISQGLSAETIRANLEAMVDKATAKGVDAVLASTIRRMNLPGHSPTSDLRGEIESLAGELERDFVNPFGPLCPILACFDEHYYQGDQEIGHIDASGYEIMTDLWEDAIRADPTPGEPVQNAPSGEVNTETPTFEWTDLSEANWYQLQIDVEDGVRLVDTMVDATTECTGGTCSFVPQDPLPEGDLEWRVRARNLFDYGGWSGWTNFVIAVSLPGPPDGIAPAGDFYVATPVSFLHEWTEAVDADEYNLRILDDRGDLLFNQIVSASCSGGVCSTTPSKTLDAGEFVWRVRGVNTVGNGLWSSDLPFAVYDSVPSTVVLEFPDADTFQVEPTYRWREIGGATGYELAVEEVGGSEVVRRSYNTGKCGADGFCSSTPSVALTPGTQYRWRMRASNPFGNGSWAPWTTFEVLECANPKNVTLTNRTITGSETHVACGTLTVSDGVVVKASATVTFHGGEDVVLESELEIEEGADVTLRVDDL